MDNDIIAIMYSQLKCILVCSMGDERIWGDFCNSTLLLVLVRPVKTDGKDTALMTIIFSQYLAPIITDLQNVKAVVGRAETQKHWGIVAHSVGIAKPAFALDETEDYHQDGDDPELSDFD